MMSSIVRTALLASALMAPAMAFAQSQTSNTTPPTHDRPHRHHGTRTGRAPVIQPHPPGSPRHAGPAHPAIAAPAPTAPAPAVLTPPPAAAASTEPQKGSNTGLPLPRFASLRSDEVNLRTGPGTRYPIDWIYKRRDLPVQIEREFEVWRLVSDMDGVRGWVHQATLVGRRTVVVTGAERPLRSAARDDADPVARLKPGVIARIKSCEANSDWCEVQLGDYRGFLRRAEVWGTLPGEAVQ